MQGGKCIGAASLPMDLPTMIGTVSKVHPLVQMQMM